MATHIVGGRAVRVFCVYLLAVFFSTTAWSQQVVNKILNEPADNDAVTGETVEYTLQAQCSDFSIDCGPTTITDTLPPELENPNCVGAGGFTCMVVGNTITFSTANFTAGSTVDLTITARVALGADPASGVVNSGVVNQRDGGNLMFSTGPGDQLDVLDGSPQYSISKTRVSNSPVVDFPVVYRLEFCATTGIGNESLSDLTLVDTFPMGASVLDAGGGVVAGNTITWNAANLNEFAGNGNAFDIPTAYASGSLTFSRCITRTIVLRYDSPTFMTMDMVTNSASGTGVRADDMTGVGPIGDDVTDTLGDPMPAVGLSKSASDVRPGVGEGPMVWNLNSNIGSSNVPVLDLTIYEAIPPAEPAPLTNPTTVEPISITSGRWNSPMFFDAMGVEQTSDVRATIAFSTDVISVPSDCAAVTYPMMNELALDISSPGSSQTYPLPMNATCVRWQFRDANPDATPPDSVPLGWNFTTSPQLRLRTENVVGADDPVDMTFPITIENCLYTTFDSDSDPLTMGDSTAQACGSAEIEDGTAAANLNKNRTVFQPDGVTPRSGNPLPGDEIVYRLRITHNNANSTADLTNPIVTDLLDEDVEFLGWDDYDDNSGADPMPYMEVIPSFIGNQTLVRFAWYPTVGEIPAGAVDFMGNPATMANPASFSEAEDPIDIRIRVRIKDGTPAGTNIFNEFLLFDRGPRFSCGGSDTVPPTDTESGVDFSGNDADGDGMVDNDPLCDSNNNNASVGSAAVLGGSKFVRGNLMPDRPNVDDPFASPEINDLACPGGLTGFTRTPCVAQTDHVLEENSDPTFDYRLDVVNTGNVPLRDYTLYDVLPDVNDTGVGPALFGLPRGSTFRVEIDGAIAFDGATDINGTPIPDPANITIEYTTAALPCRNELEGPPPFSDPWPMGCSNTYGPLPADPSQVTGFRIRIPFGEGGMGMPWQPGERLSFTVPMRAPEGSLTSTPSLFEDGMPTNDIFNPAWNTFAHRARRDDNSNYLLAAEPPRVGVILPEAYRIGNLVWLDSNHNGIAESGEPGIEDVDVNVCRDETGDGPSSDDRLFSTTTTDAAGKYVFTGLPRGQYYLVIPDGQDGMGGPLEQLFTSRFNQDTTDSDTDNRDDGFDLVTAICGFDRNGNPGAAFSGLSSAVVQLGPVNPMDPLDSETSSEQLRADDATDDDNDGFEDAFSNLTIDFGYYRPFALGNRVWVDDGAGANLNNGFIDPDESGFDNVAVELLNGGGSPFDSDPETPGVQALTDTTASGGYYLFDDLPAGDFRVRITLPATGEAYASSTGSAAPPFSFEPAPDPDAAGAAQDRDSDDNGSTVVAGSVFISEIVTLGTGAVPAEPTTDTDRPAVLNPQGTGPDGNEIPDMQSNLSVDFGVYPAVSIGSTVFFDDDADGFQDVGESAVPGVDLEIWFAGADEMIGGGDDVLVTTVMTNGSGDYFAGGLEPNKYFVQIPATNFAGALAPAPTSSLPTSTADDETDGDDNGSQGDSGTVVTSPVIMLTPGDEPENTGDETEQGNGQDADDDNGDMTIDFGFVPTASLVSIGSTVFADPNDNGFQDGGELGLSGVTVELLADLNDSGTIDGAETTAFRTTMTNGSGDYFFGDLSPGVYQVRIPTPPAGHLLSSTPTDVLDNREDSDDNGSQVAIGDVTISPLISLAPGQEPLDTGPETGQGNGQDAGADENGDMTVDFGFVPVVDVVSVGSTVFLDPNNSGLQDMGEMGIASVTVNLMRTGIDGMIGTADDVVVASTVTDPSGNYFFGNLPAGDYFIELPVPPATAPLSSTPTVLADDNTDGDDNGDQPAGIGTVVRSGLFNLAVDDERTDAMGETFQGNMQDAADDNNGNMSIDFGFVPVSDVVAIGSTVFEDPNNNGFQDVGELGIPGVGIELYDPGMDGVPDGGDDIFIASSMTNGSGDYFFGNLPAREYFLRISTPPATAPLSSTPDDPADNFEDQDDNGLQPGGIGAPVTSPVIRLDVNGEIGPEPGQGGMQDNGDDDNGDMTVDFGFVPVTDVVSIGSTVFFDPNDDGFQNSGELGIPGTTIQLWQAGPDMTVGGPDDVFLATGATDTNGDYFFGNLPPDTDYYLRIPTPPLGAPLSSSAAVTDTADNREDGDDNGIQTGGINTEVVSPVIRLTVDGEPLGDGMTGVESEQGGAQDDVDDDNGDMTIDFGFIPATDLVAIGSTVFADPNNNGFQDGGESGIAGITLELFDPGLDGMIGGADDVSIGTAMTDVNGDYVFTNLPPGPYYLQIDTPPAALPLSSTPTDTADNQQDEDDNGEQPGGSGTVVTSPIILLSADGEPTGNGMTGTESGSGGAQDDADDNNGDMTIDFGFVDPATLVSIGSTVFLDAENNGIQDAGDLGVDGIAVELWDSGTDGMVGGGDDTLVATTATAGGGDYLFDNRVPGQYYVRIPTPPAGSTLSSTPTSTADDRVDSDDNGSQPGGAGSETLSPVIELTIDGEPTGNGMTGTEAGQGGAQDDADDDNGDMTIDFGFIQGATAAVSIGSTVFEDPNNNGVQDGGESGIAGVAVELFDPGTDEIAQTGDDFLIVSSVTDGMGNYFFGGLPPRNYYIRVPTPPAGLPLSSTPTSTADDRTDGDDNGIQAGGLGTQAVSPLIDLAVGAEPNAGQETFQGGGQDDAEETNGDMTIDFGFLAASDVVSIGSTVFLDNDNNGLQDGPDAGIPGILVELRQGAANAAPDALVDSALTDAQGDYFFGNLPPGDYYVQIPTPPPAAPLSSTPTDSNDNGEDEDDNGVQPGGIGALTRSPDITLTPDAEPVSEPGQGGGQDVADDNNGDMTVDFGFVPVTDVVAIGSTVFEDPNDDGTQNGGELGLAGVNVELWRPGMDGMIGGGDDVLLSNTPTDGSGNYLFDNLPPDVYYVRLPVPPASAPLSSTPTDAADNSEDGDDNGTQSGIGAPTTSPLIMLSVDGEVTGGAELFQGGTQDDVDDNNGDMTVDFGFIPQSELVAIGSTVFEDPNDNGLQDPGETGIGGVTVELYSPGSDGVIGGGDDALVGSTVTSGGGDYLFADLPAGLYYIRIPTPPAGLPLSSAPTDIADNGVDGNDNGDQPAGLGGEVFSPVVDLRPNTESTTEPFQGGTQDDTDDNNGDMTVDFGFTPIRYDLALSKVLAAGQSSMVDPLDSVRFDITVINQGNQTAANIVVVDYLPTGLSLNDPQWMTLPGNRAQRGIAGTLAPGDSVVLTLDTIVDADALGQLINFAEIREFTDTGGSPQPDIDSVPDDNPGNDAGGDPGSPADDATGGDGTGPVGGGDPGNDEDDHDPEVVTVSGFFDLSIEKVDAPGTPNPVQVGQTVEFLISVTNEGTITAANIEIVDYVPVGLIPADANWTVSGDQMRRTIAGPLDPGLTITVSVLMQVTEAALRAPGIVNVAEIASATDPVGNIIPDIDSDPDPDPGNDPPDEDDIDRAPLNPPTPLTVPTLHPVGLVLLTMILLVFGRRRVMGLNAD